MVMFLDNPPKIIFSISREKFVASHSFVFGKFSFFLFAFFQKEWQLPRETGTENQQLAQEVKILQRTAVGQTKIKVTFKIMLERRQVLFKKINNL